MPSDNPTSLLTDLIAAVGEEVVSAGADDLQYYGSDRCRGTWSAAPAAIALPRTIEQVVALVQCCARHGAHIVPSGGRTGLTGGATATAGEVVLSLERMHKILEVDRAARTLRCQAGATVEAVQLAAAEAGLLYPVDFAAKGSAQIGGSIATNAGGVKVLRYGGTRTWVGGIKVVLASGQLVELGGGLVKDNTGYDLRQLFIGSEGTLGIIVEATMRLDNPARGAVVALCAVPDDPKVVTLFERVQRALPLQAFECFDSACVRHVLAHKGSTGAGPFSVPSYQHALVEVEVEGFGPDAVEATHDALTECLGEAQEAGEITDAVVAATNAQAQQLWSLREDISESLHRHRPHKADIALPVAKIMDFLATWRVSIAQHMPTAEPVIFGHVGDGNLHLNIVPPPQMEPDVFVAECHAFDEVTYGLIRDYGGSVSAEHGIGLLKRDHLHYSRDPAQVEMMRAIKRALDPQGLFNPGKIFVQG